MSYTGGPSQDEGGSRYPTKIYNDGLGKVSNDSVGNGKGSFSSGNKEYESGSNERNNKQSNGDNNSFTSKNAQLAYMLRECAKYVEKGEFNPILYQAMGALHVYTGERAGTAPIKGPDDNDHSSNNVHNHSEKGKLRGKFLGKDHNLHKNIASLNLGSIGKKIWNATNHVTRPQNSSNSSTRTLNDPPSEEGVEWCEEHFVAGCQCKKNSNLNEQGALNQMRPTQSDPNNPNNPNGNRINNDTNNTETPVHLDKQNFPSKPSFQRPVNPNSNLIANGWISQQRRSKMRIVWKDILASLVEGRKQGEETTLWIQRQIVTPTGKAELEALHQIPMKWLEDVTYVDMYGDFRFTLKVFNVNEEFQFRCRDAESAQNWVLTLRNARDMARSAQAQANHNQIPPENVERPMHSSGKPMEPNTNVNQSRSHTPTPVQDVKQMSVKELKSIVHGAGYSSYGLEKADLQRIVGSILNNGALPKPTNHEQASPARKNGQTREDSERINHKEEYNHHDEPNAQENLQQKREFGADEQERRRLLEEAAARERLRKQHEEKVANEKKKQQEEEEKRRQHEEAIARKRLLQKTAMAEEERRKYEEAAARDRLKQQYEEKAAAAAAKMKQAELERMRTQQQEYAAAEERRKKEEAQAAAAQERIRLQQQEQAQAAAAKERLRQQQEQAAVAAAQERIRQQQEQAAQERIRRQQQEQAAAAQERIRQQQEQAAAAQERLRQQQQEQWQKQQWQQQQQQQQQEQWQKQQWQQQQHQQQQQQYHNHQQWNQQHHPQPPYSQAPPPNHQQAGFTGGPQPQQARPGPGDNTAEFQSKYAKAIAEEDDGQAAITALKRNILLNWALQPPSFNALKPIHFLVTSIHGVFPPAFNVKGHAYFAKWKPFSESDLQISAAMGNNPDEEKLKKAVRKIRFFLHPDKLPKDLDEHQQFMCKMLWDVTSDAWEEHIKKNEELDWIQP